jgi:hypothetical protein
MEFSLLYDRCKLHLPHPSNSCENAGWGSKHTTQLTLRISLRLCAVATYSFWTQCLVSQENTP